MFKKLPPLYPVPPTRKGTWSAVMTSFGWCDFHLTHGKFLVGSTGSTLRITCRIARDKSISWQMKIHASSLYFVSFLSSRRITVAVNKRSMLNIAFPYRFEDISGANANVATINISVGTLCLLVTDISANTATTICLRSLSVPCRCVVES